MGGHFYQHDASVFDNTANGTLYLNSPRIVYPQYPYPQENAAWSPSPSTAQASLVNNGTIIKSSQSNIVYVTLNNYGSLSCTGGVLGFSSASTGTNFGTFDVGASGTINFVGGYYALDVAGTIQGSGAVLFSSTPSVELRGTYAVTGSTTVSGGLVTFKRSTTWTSLGTTFSAPGGMTIFETVPATFPPQFVIAGGVVDFGNNTFTMPNLTQSAGTLTSANNITIGQTLVMSGGSHAGSGATILAGTSSFISGAATTLLGRKTVNIGSVVWSSGDIYMSSTQSFYNFQNFTASANAVFRAALPTQCAFVNAGTLVVANAGSSVWAFPLINKNLVQINAGVLSLTGNATLDGVVQVAAGATLEFAGGYSTLTATSSVSGSGTVSYPTGGLVNAYGSYTVATSNVVGGYAYFQLGSVVQVPTMTLSAGWLSFSTYAATATSFTLSGTGNLEVNGQFYTTNANWVASSVTGTGNWTVNTLQLDSTSPRHLFLSVLQLNGYARWTRGHWYGYAGAQFVVASTATFDIYNSYTYPCGACFYNLCHNCFDYYRMYVGSGSPKIVVFGQAGKYSNYRTTYIDWDVDVNSGSLDTHRAYWWLQGAVTMRGGNLSQAHAGVLSLTNAAATHSLMAGTFSINGNGVNAGAYFSFCCIVCFSNQLSSFCIRCQPTRRRVGSPVRSTWSVVRGRSARPSASAAASAWVLRRSWSYPSVVSRRICTTRASWRAAWPTLTARWPSPTRRTTARSPPTPTDSSPTARRPRTSARSTARCRALRSHCGPPTRPRSCRSPPTCAPTTASAPERATSLPASAPAAVTPWARPAPTPARPSAAARAPASTARASARRPTTAPPARRTSRRAT